MGYTTSAGVYLPSVQANGAIITIISGSATLYSGHPDAASHQGLITLTVGETYQVTDLAPGEVLSVQSDFVFTYQLALPSTVVASEVVTWTCTGSPCPWGSSLSGQALVWPESAEPTSNRLGYTTSAAIYLSADRANGVIVAIVSGSGTLYAGHPGAGSHRVLAMLAAGESLEVVGLAPGEVLSVQSVDGFTYEIELPGAEILSSEMVTWACTGGPCPWGESTSGQALVWPASAESASGRLGYTTSAGVYLPSVQANGAIITIISGSATLYSGHPDAASHQGLITLTVGETYQVTDLAPGEVLSVQSDFVFTYQLALPSTVVASEVVTWTCTGSPCPWGSSLSGQALVWPESAEPTSNRLGYTTSAAIYLSADRANGVIVAIVSGSGTLYAGHPGAGSHRVLAMLAAGESLEVVGLAPGEVLSVQSVDGFTYEIELPGAEILSSEMVTWACTGGPCPWGESTSGQALVWPASAESASGRLGYTTSAGVYLPSVQANGAIITIISGSATLYSGHPDAASHQGLITLTVGETYQVTHLAPGEVLSVQSDFVFTYQLALPSTDAVLHSIPAYWRCNILECTSGDWSGSVINWTSSVAYSSNNRLGENSRTVFSASDEMLFPYMGAWANGCTVTAEYGVVLIVEWQRGADVWRETYLNPGETHIIDLMAPEDGAMIESNDISQPFGVSLVGCTPQPLP